ncbi:hypothetical protein JOC93_000640 [Priestia taiwanensis]|uniref:Uncharacterized protein n=1 Tax=Priestia taiwanensis TaxID=1347902 RepID=A0A917AK48_9BACI|nr:hypothetical protein [Priestia taiwanensis]GGE58770.1 hypothetical protein GCM10007140_06410 [Priestia taiwanensis]
MKAKDVVLILLFVTVLISWFMVTRSLWDIVTIIVCSAIIVMKIKEKEYIRASLISVFFVILMVSRLGLI